MAKNATLPEKFRGELHRKCWPDHSSAFDSLLDVVAVLCPRASLRSQKRYTAIYSGRSLLVYLEPRHDGIVFGFFRDNIDRVSRRLTIQPTAFPEWSKSKGGLVGFLLTGFDENLKARVADIGYMIVESYRLA